MARNTVKSEDVVYLIWKTDIVSVPTIVDGSEATTVATHRELVDVFATKQKADREIFRLYERDARTSNEFYTYTPERKVVH